MLGSRTGALCRYPNYIPYVTLLNRDVQATVGLQKAAKGGPRDGTCFLILITRSNTNKHL